MKKIGRRRVQPLGVSRILSRELLMDTDPRLAPLLREVTTARLAPGAVHDRWVSWRPAGPGTEWVSDQHADFFIRNLIEYRVQQDWETRFVGRGSRH